MAGMQPMQEQLAARPRMAGMQQMQKPSRCNPNSVNQQLRRELT
jgi:hypothetical protein